MKKFTQHHQSAGSLGPGTSAHAALLLVADTFHYISSILFWVLPLS